MGATIEDQIKKALLPVRITKLAFEKGNYIAHRIGELAKRPVEIFMYAVEDREFYKKKEIFIDDLYIAKDQRVTSTTCNVSPVGQKESLEDIANNYRSKILGWAHSHANFDTFHSPKDDSTSKKTTKSDGAKIEHEFEHRLARAASINIIKTVQGEQRSLVLDLNGKKYMINSDFFNCRFFDSDKLLQEHFIVTEFRKRPVLFSYSIVFNSGNQKPYCVLGYETDNGVSLVKDVDYEIIGNHSSKNIDKNIIDSQIIHRVDKLRQIYDEKSERYEKILNVASDHISSIENSINAIADKGFEDLILIKKYKISLNLIHRSDEISRLAEQSNSYDNYTKNKFSEKLSDINARIRDVNCFLDSNHENFLNTAEELIKDENWSCFCLYPYSIDLKLYKKALQYIADAEKIEMIL